ncbi:MAG: MTAP family purine nucleoside phosphorylase [Bdellovibrionales bacterium]|nr:MTAP family purine nucleoside phosphorylase [Bdellovibrionales bacterium]
MWAIIGGSGFEKFDGFETVEELYGETPFGMASSGLKKVRVNGTEALFLSRHGAHHELTPSEVNYRANIFALKYFGAKSILSFSAVGSLREELAPGDLVIPNQYIDRTKGIREHTFSGDGIVGHVSLAKPVCLSAAEKTLALLPEGRDWQGSTGKTYICIEGPNFSTKAESHVYRQFGADIIGMTNFPEYALAREAGMNYLPCCFVTDYDCWNEERPHVTLEEVIDVMRANNAKAFALAQAVFAEDSSGIRYFQSGDEALEQGLRAGLMTPKEAISAEKMEWLKVLLQD